MHGPLACSCPARPLAQRRRWAYLYCKASVRKFRCFSIRPAAVKRDPAKPQLCSPCDKAHLSSHSFVRPRSFLRPSLAKYGCCRAQWRSRPAHQRRPEGLNLTAASTAACWMPLGPRKGFDAARRALLLFGMGTQALPGWDEEDEAERSKGRPRRCSDGRHKQRSDLASSFVPRGTTFRQSGENQSLSLSGYASR